MQLGDYFKDKRVTVMGLGLLGRGIGDAKFIAQAGAAEVVVTDMKPADVLESSVAQLREFSNITFVLGEHREEDFINRDFILVAAGVPMDSPYLAVARKAGVPLKQSAALFAEISGVPIIGITGTRGKSTVTHLIHHALSVITGERILLGGNVRGVSNLQLLNEVGEDSLCVMELDSWQLQGFGWTGLSPQVAVFTNFMEDHLNYYERGAANKEEAMDRYFADKAQIFIHQKENGTFITTPEVFARAREFAGKHDTTLGQEVVLADASVLPEELSLTMPGEHNRLNAALSYEALKAIGLTEEEILPALASFPGVEGRLERVAVFGGVPIYNDNNATTPTATATGIEAVAAGKNVVLLTGGTDKSLDVSPLVTAIAGHVVHTILYSGTGTEALKAALPAGASYEEHVDFKAAVTAALATVTPGNVLLFSPAFASFNHEFRNEYERNDAFKRVVRSIVDGDEDIVAPGADEAVS